MGEAVRPAREPYRPSTKNLYKSIFSMSYVNSDCIFEFYAKCYVRICLVSFIPLLFLQVQQRRKKYMKKKMAHFLMMTHNITN